MKHSLKKIISKFNKYPTTLKGFMEEVLITEDDKIEIDRPQVMKDLENKLDEIADKEFDKE